jgi:hypothetical protein
MAAMEQDEWELPAMAGGDQPRERPRITRRRVMEGAALAGAAGVVATAALRAGSPVSIAQQQPAGGDAELVELAATLFGLETAYLQRGLDSGILSGRDLEIVTEVWNLSDAQQKLIDELLREIGGAPVQGGEFRFPDQAFASRNAFLELAAELEELWVGGFHGMLTSLTSPELFASGVAIAGVRSRCAAAIAALIGRDPLPNPVEQPLSAADVLNRLAEYRAA